MRLSYSLGSLLTINQILECSKKLNVLKPDTVWIPETWGMENFSMLSLACMENKFSKIGSSIINIYSRSPSLIAMGAATVDTISNKRLVLGLGTSTKPLIEDFHGDKFEKPVKRMKEYVEIIRLILTGKTINYSGEIFSLKDFSLLIKPQIITCIHEDPEKAIFRAKKTIAFYVSVGKIYREFLAQNGFKNETKNIFEEYKKTGLINNHELVPGSMVNELCISGTSDECKKQLKQFRETGINLPIIQFNPIDNVQDSFDLVTSTFSEESN